MRVLRVYHGGRIPAHRVRERALVAPGVEVTLVMPTHWPEGQAMTDADEFPTYELPVSREGDVNRHAYRSQRALRKLIDEVRPDVLDPIGPRCPEAVDT